MPISTVLSWQALLFAEAFRTLSLSQVQNASIYYLVIQQTAGEADLWNNKAGKGSESEKLDISIL